MSGGYVWGGNVQGNVRGNGYGGNVKIPFIWICENNNSTAYPMKRLQINKHVIFFIMMVHIQVVAVCLNYNRCRKPKLSLLHYIIIISSNNFTSILTSVSETIRKLPLVKVQIALKIKNKIKYGEKRISIWRMELLHPGMWHDHDIDFARDHSSKLLSIWENRLFAFWRQDLRWCISAILDFRGPIMGSLKRPCTTSYKSSKDTIALNCLVFEKIAFFYILATDRLTNRHTNRWTALSSSRCREWRLNKGKQPLRLLRGRCITITIPHNRTCLEKR